MQEQKSEWRKYSGVESVHRRKGMAAGGRGMPQKGAGGVLKIPNTEGSKASRIEPGLFTAANKARRARGWSQGTQTKVTEEFRRA